MSMESILPFSKQEEESLKKCFLYSLKRQSIWGVLDTVCILFSEAAVDESTMYLSGDLLSLIAHIHLLPFLFLFLMVSGKAKKANSNVAF